MQIEDCKSTLGFLSHVVVKCYRVLKHCAATNFRVTELVTVNAKVTGGRKCVCCIEQFEGVSASHICGRCEEAIGLSQGSVTPDIYVRLL